jgi:hypothetical protein
VVGAAEFETYHAAENETLIETPPLSARLSLLRSEVGSLHRLRQLAVSRSSHIPVRVDARVVQREREKQAGDDQRSRREAKKKARVPNAPPQFNENSLKSVVVLPRREDGQLGRVDLVDFDASGGQLGALLSEPALSGVLKPSISAQENQPHLSGSRMNAGEVDASEEGDGWRLVGVGSVADNVERVDAVLVDRL